MQDFYPNVNRFFISPCAQSKAGSVSFPSWEGEQAMQALSPREAGLVSSQGAAQAVQVLSQRQVVLVPPHQEGEQAMQVISPRQPVVVPRYAELVSSQEGVQALQVYSPRQAVLVPWQAASVPPARKEWRQYWHSSSGRLESQSQPRCFWCYSGGCCFFPRQYNWYDWGTRAGPGG